ncbi:DUF6194 family protein [Streptomyces sp. NPDC048504]|uniref:DUF6194 family protein n=1 Tax=Streptomyces sp. NPDC048504 TaxID=3365559 RepID=UPI0037112635
MSMEQIIATVRDFTGTLVLVPEPGGEFPELAWGDAFFYYAPDGQLPRNVQPYGTVVTKDYKARLSQDLPLNHQTVRPLFPPEKTPEAVKADFNTLLKRIATGKTWAWSIDNSM